jgi:Lon protease-like protein
VLLPAARLDLRLEAALWSNPLRDIASPGLAVFFRPSTEVAFPKVGTLAAIIGRRRAGGVIHVRLRGLRRVIAETAPPHSAAMVDVVIDPDSRPGKETGGGLQTLLRRYHAALAEHGERADITADLPDSPDAAVYRVASLLRISDHERQFLLEGESTADRVRRVATVLGRETELLRSSMRSRGA